MSGQRSLSSSDISLISRFCLTAALACLSLSLLSCPNPVSVNQVVSDLGLSVVATIPADGATDFNPGQPIVVSFNKDLDPACLQGIPPVVIAPSSSNPMTLTFSYDSTSKQLTVEPHPYLQSNSTYTVSFETTLKDSSGAALPKKVDLTFTTGDAPAGDIQINGGAAYVTSNDAATLNVVNNASATLMRVANSVADLGSAPFFNAGTRNWPLGSGDGTKTVYAQFFNADKSLSSPVRLASIVRDTQPPTIQSASVPQYYNASNNASNLAIAAVTASDATSGVDTYTWSGAGVSFNTSPPYSAQSPAFTIAGPDGNYSVSITATDRAGNTSHEQKFAITKKTSIPAAPTEGVGSWSKLSPVTEQSPITWIWNASSNSDSPPDTILEKLDTESSWTSHTLADHSRVMTLGDGTHILSVVQVDFAGNQSSVLNLQIIVTPVIPLDRQIANGNPPQLSWRNFGGGQEYTVHVRLEGASSDLYDVDVGTIPHYQVPNAYLAGTQFSWYVEWPGGRSPPAQAVDQYYHYSVR